ncbi:DNA-J related domain-containing protein [Psychrobium sp. 1_MG-2023]|uniref:DNA-J related domain-containing protein n=1 Tax=Psychrobium sp. 1_MG-2023 TaxID=3062624 RepID=UPI000C3251C9|nr:DNA-J related domain-containing protein [Psychrobium sp. 1_MG-2023]MDP2562770.1 DNA-J related domain-containing protein [Psychrobium sp. 1_MG-2023]PKF57694.1 molecular chaperone DnaJ [Alteromonadales bacterium alter-6D02]
MLNLPDESISHRFDDDNPLVWPILSLLNSQDEPWKVHHLVTALREQAILPEFVGEPNQVLFKANFLVMNALFQLQQFVLPTQRLSVSSLHIALSDVKGDELALVGDDKNALADYYLDWRHFDAEEDEITELLTSFWLRYQQAFVTTTTGLARDKALAVFELDADTAPRLICKRWRELALRWHPDREGGDSAQFRLVCQAWQVLKP